MTQRQSWCCFLGVVLPLTVAASAAEPAKAPRPEEASRAFHRQMVTRANDAVARARAQAEKDPGRPGYHFQAPAMWMNDPNGPLFYQGEYHLFYQHNPYGTDWGHMHWGHARSKDLVHWEHLPIALAPSTDRGEEHCFSGSAVVRDGVPTIFYTSIGPKTPAADGAVQWTATSADGMMTWDKYPGNPVLTAELHRPLVIRDWRDPFVWKEGDRWLMVLGGHREGGHGCAEIYQSPDLVHWKFLNVLYEGAEKNWECPNFFQLGDKWVLIYSPHGPVKYFTGTLDGDYRFRPETHGTLDLSTTFYAPNSLADPHGRRLLWGWVRVKGDGWNGALTLPRVLTLRADGRLGMEPAPELTTLRGRHQHYGPLTLTPAFAGPLKGVKGDCLEVLAEFDPGDARVFGLKVRGPADGKDETAVFLDRDHKRIVAGAARGAFELRDEEPTLRLHVFLDRSILEVYANGRECLTSPLPAKSAAGLTLDLFAQGGTAVARSVEVWEIKSIGEEKPGGR